MITTPLLMPVFLGALVAILLFPFVDFLEKRRFPASISVVLVTLGVTFLVLVPSAFMVFYGARAAADQLGGLGQLTGRIAGVDDLIQKFVNTKFFARAIQPAVNIMLEESADITPYLKEGAQILGVKVGSSLGLFVTQIPRFLIGLAIMVISLFFFLLDGKKLISVLRKYSFFSPKETDSLIEAFGSMCRSVIFATLISGLFQALTFSITCLFFGVGNFVLILLSVFFSSFIPLVGTTPVTMGVAVVQFLEGRTAVGIALVLVGLVVSSLDNLIRPLILRGAGNLHPLLAFVATFGGLETFGIPGLFLGPIVAGMFVVVLRILFKFEESSATN